MELEAARQAWDDEGFPFASVELSLLAVHHDLARLAATLLRDDRLRVYSIEAWAKYTGAADYEQEHHRDYLSQTLVVPSQDRRYQQVEMFVYLVDVPAALGPPSFIPRRCTEDRSPGVARDPVHALARWHDFVVRATPQQLALFGFPPPGHPYWTEETITGTAAGYPGLDLSTWRQPNAGEASPRGTT